MNNNSTEESDECIRVGGKVGVGRIAPVQARGKKTNHAAAKAPRGARAVFQFNQPVEASKKRRAEEQLSEAARGRTVTEQIQSLKTLIVQLIDQNEDRQEEVEKQRQEIGALRSEIETMRKLLQQSKPARATYATAATTGMKAAPTADATRPPRGDRVMHSQRLRVEDDGSAITINTTRFRGEKTDFALVMAGLQQGIDATPAVQGVKIKCLRQLPSERINIVFASEADTAKAKEHSGWLNIAMPEAYMKSDAWYPVKCDIVSKQAVLDATVEGGRSLRREVCAEFAVDNRRDDIDFTAMKASWLSKIDPRKRTGSLVIWLKNKVAADYLLMAGQALFGGGAYGAFCSRYEPSTADKICFNCNAYGHL
ncbi:hypothetical protein CKM354_000005000 [Cercospora kikuchii]|uniref:Uncharacterized protein n=1 Tax=Cercospora kikuchii TaxID=84275 RepID=A0A9P3CAH9_9PEZI|nr:uncharacterized protein CKM354_000005000 [Cercospora kikuchii]GIZ36580.1 hypothetical protein CKM354_000005000 [Cercospora kikuchii]